MAKLTADSLTDEQTLAVACPTCLVTSGIQCTSLNRSGYAPIRHSHPARRANAAEVVASTRSEVRKLERVFKHIPKATGVTLSDDELAGLAKVKAATCMRAGGGPLSNDVAKLTYLAGWNKKVTLAVMLKLEELGLIVWRGSNIITPSGDAVLTEQIAARTEAKP